MRRQRSSVNPLDTVSLLETEVRPPVSKSSERYPCQRSRMALDRSSLFLVTFTEYIFFEVQVWLRCYKRWRLQF